MAMEVCSGAIDAPRGGVGRRIDLVVRISVSSAR